VAATLTGGGMAVLCTYTVQVMPVYTPTGLNPINLIRCPSFPLTMTILAPDNPPMAGFSAWAFGAPGTAEGSSPVQSGPQAVDAAFSRVFFHLDGRLASVTSCKVINGGIFTFAMYSTIATGDTCTSSGGTISCTAPPPPPCPATVPGSNLPTGTYNPSSSQFGYVADDTIIFNADNAVHIDPPASMSAIKSAMGASFNSASFILVDPQSSSPGEGFPAPAFLCVYDSPQFEYMHQAAKAQVTIGCSGSCGSL
jgi:hypothetical protein